MAVGQYFVLGHTEPFIVTMKMTQVYKSVVLSKVYFTGMSGQLAGALLVFASSLTIYCCPLLPSFFSVLLLSCDFNLRHLYNTTCCKCRKTSTKQTINK